MIYKIRFIKFWLFLSIISSSCLDYVNTDKLNKKNYKPIIDKRHLSPSLTRPLDLISLGNNCKGQAFKIPPLTDDDPHDKLYYLWFLDNRLISKPEVIEPSQKDSTIIAINLNRNFLENLFENKIPNDFFDNAHFLEFLVSDKPFTLPESRYIDEKPDNEKNHIDQVIWNFRFNNNNC